MKYLVLDVGGSSIKYALMDEKANFLFKDKVLTPKNDKEEFIEIINEIYDKYVSEIEGVAISMPGMIDSKKGYAYNAGFLTYLEQTNIVDILSVHCKKKITVENDGKCCAKAEHWLGSLKECDDAAVIVLGSGIGGGIISNGQVLKGKHFSAGEFSFMKTSLDENKTLDNIWALKNGSSFLSKSLAKKKNVHEEEIDGIKFFELANNGDKDTLDVLDEFCKNLCVGIFNLQTLLDCEKIAIGGGISAQAILFEYINKNLKAIYDDFPLKIPRAEVIPSKYRNDANLIGALYTYLYEN